MDAPGTTSAYDQDGLSTTFSTGELASIQEIWSRVAEKYSPFNIDVTTEDPINRADRVTCVIVIGTLLPFLCIVAALRHLFAVVENYPDLKASEHFLKLQDELANTEDRIQAARRFYNATVRDYNTRVQSFPSNVIAGAFGFKIEEYFQLEPALRAEAEQPPSTYFA